MKIALIAVVLLLVICSIAYAIPNPVGYVNDFSSVLSSSERHSLEVRISDIEKNTGVEIAIVTTNDLQNETIETYSVQLFQQWGIGKKGQDNGLLIILVPSTHQYRFEVGYGLEGILNDAKVGRFGRECFQTYFANNSYYDGFSCALDDVSAEINAGYENVPITLDTPTIILIVIVIIVIIILAIITKGGIFRILLLLLSVATRGGFGGGRSGGGGAGGKY